MIRPQARWLEGKTIAHVAWNEFGNGRGGRACAPVLYFSDGSSLSFSVVETDVGEYGLDPVYVPSSRRSRGKK